MSGRARAPLRCVMLLPSIHFVLKAEQLCRRQQLAHDLVPVPRQISSDCGMALAFQCGDLEMIKALISQAALPAPRLFRLDENNEFVPLVGEA